ncbi:cleavage and polyadenylation specificity factor subunit 1-like [Anopheles albimanus]|uniref:cleavage and polyadenylation specificity factor subunit 1-like n=1 Tax=Anopheles albimanus TaxID=7167 RepID=UPI00163E7910|nr:cleavage and polyadenylation specificity factor subunit 1-like [Anopheles albimanus]
MFSLCKQPHEATAVEFSLTCHFFNHSEKSLVTGGANVLKVYRIIPDADPATRDKYSATRPPNMKLECMASYRLFGNIRSLQSVSLAGSQRDALLISFPDAKLSVVQFDPDNFDLKTLSLHYFEDEDIRGGWTGHYHIPLVRVDPDNRCAVMLVYGRKLVVLPFRKDSSLDEIEMQDVKPIKKTPTLLIAKTPILASYIIELKDLDEKIDNVIDVQFLHGYYEPTLLILYEPVRTFPGRIAVRSDTCTMVALSLNIQQRVHPVIWTVNSLPFDCLQAVPISKPIGGCLVMCVNSLIYLNQSVPPYGVSLNSSADHSTNFPLKPQDGVRISLDAAQVCFIESEKLVLSLKGGELYVLTLCADSMRSVRSFHFSKAAASVLTSCICVCETEYLFLGSRLGNSLLLRFREKDESLVITIDDSGTVEKEQKRQRLEEEELEVYGSGYKTSVQLTSYIFEVCDSVLNVGPIAHMAVGERICEEEMEEGAEVQFVPSKLDVEVVTASGHGKNGALCVLQSSIKPQVITSFGLSGCLDVWTVFDEAASPAGTRKPDDAPLPNHAFMILSQEGATMVLQTGEEINEIENTGFATDVPTIHVGNIGTNRFIVQVTTKSIRLLQGTRLLQNIPIDLGCPLASVSIVDPYVCVRSSEGRVITLALREGKGTPRLAVNKNTISASPPVIAISAYRDVSGMFTRKLEDSFDVSKGGGATSAYSSGFGSMKPEPNMKIEDEEDLLYGESGRSFKVTSMADMALADKGGGNADFWLKYMQQVKPTYWLLAARDNGNLEIYSMPDLKLAYLISNVGNGNKVLSDSMEFVPLPLAKPGASQEEATSAFGASFGSGGVPVSLLPKEILMVALGSYGSRPILFIRLEQDLLMYRVFRYAKGHLKLRFKRLTSSVTCPAFRTVPARLANLPDKPPATGSATDTTESNGKDTQAQLHATKVQYENISMIRYFGNVSGYAGVAVCGEKPYFLFLTGHGELRSHRLYARTVMKAFAPFNNVNCPNGFLYFDEQYQLKISILPTYLSYDSVWPVRKIPLRSSPKQIVYHRENRVYCVVMDAEEICNKYYRFNGEDKELTEENKGERFLYPMGHQFSVVLVNPAAWEIVPDTAIALEEWEHVVSLKNVSLAYEGARSGLKEYIAVGTNFNYSEDITSRGRLLLYDIIEVVPEPGKPLTKHKFKEVIVKDQKGPVSAISHVCGFLVGAVGQKVYLWQMKDDDLVGVAFIDTNIFVHQMVSIKSLILVADVYKSVSLLRFQDEFRTLSLVSRDYHPLNVYQVEYVVDNTNLGFLVADDQANLITYMYQPESRESFGGQRLLRKGDYHLGQRVNAMFRVQCDFHESDVMRRALNYDNKHTTFFATLDGGFGFVLPLPEKTYRRLFMLQNVLLTHSPHTCGLNPKAYRTIKQSRALPINPSRCVVDGDLVWSFLELPANEKQEVAKKIGTRIEEICADLMEIEHVTHAF